jgi:hypothetical protein
MEWIRQRLAMVPPRLWRALFAATKAYVALLVATFVLGLCFYFSEGREWEGSSHEPEDLRVEPWAKQGGSEHAHEMVSGSAFDESLWLAFCVAHSMSFGEFTPRTGAGRAVVCVTAFVGYWTQVCLASIVLLAHVPGDSDRFRSAAAVFTQMVRSAWASFLVLFVLILVMGLGLSNELVDREENYDWSVAADGMYLAFLVAHKVSFGEVLVGSVAGRTALGILEQASLLHVVIVLAMVGLRRRTEPEHQALLSALNQDPTDTTFLGAGYVLERAGWPVEPVEPVEDTAGIELTMRAAGAGNTTEEGSDPGGGEESRGKVVLSRN